MDAQLVRPRRKIRRGTELPLKAYILDNTGLASVVLNGKTPSALTKVNDAFWVLDLKMTENGTYTIDVVDDAGNRTVHELEVDWFNVQTTHDTSAAVPQVEAVLMKRGDGEGQDVELTADAKGRRADPGMARGQADRRILKCHD